MKTMQTLTIGGETYAIYDPEAARIDNEKVGDTTWSSRTLVERLCPVLTVRGEAPVCQPVAGYPLGVVSGIKPVQEGTPSPQSPSPITGHTAVTLTLSNGEESGQHTYALGQTVYGGDLNWDTGVLTVKYACLELTGTESWNAEGNIEKEIYRYYFRPSAAGSHSLPQMSSHYPYTNGYSVKTEHFYINGKVSYFFSAISTLGEFKAYLAEQAANGTPVQLCYEMTEPYTVQLDPQQIIALSGVNTLQSDTGETAVTYRAELSAFLQKLCSSTAIN